ncbi:MAG: carboxypeptidase M32 [Thermoleophilia bacterium]|nr:carboxypeptidase M32 [Thermoleophilia bacterium]
MEQAFTELKERLGKLTDLRRAEGVLVWDMTVFMPPGGGPTRAAQLATLHEITHEYEIDESFGELFEKLEPYAASLPPDSEDACLIRVAQRDWSKARRVPTELATEFALAQAQSYDAWVRARENSDFASFRPWLERMLDLRLRYVECFAPYDDPYDVLLDDFEPGMKTDEIRAVFAVLEPELVSLVQAHATDEKDDFMSGPFPIASQEALSRELIGRFGATWDQFRLDTTVHPFEVTFGLGDIRLTTRYREDDLISLFTAMHECGHGLYEWGVNPSFERTPLCSGCSAALHESQSRLWENVVGRSLPFWRWFHPRLQETFPEKLGGVPLESLHRAVNRTRRSFIRVDADETSYGLHVILRFDLEQRLISGELAVEDLPDAWNARFEELLGIPVPNDQLGVLQDAHWSGGSFGYFPTYLLGTVLSVQIWEKARAAIPDVDEQIERGDFHQLHMWLRENIYALGRKFTPAETIERVVGGPIDPEPYLRYLRDKLETSALV